VRVLVVNPGSSSLKLSVVGKEDVVELRADLETGSGADQEKREVTKGKDGE
jgi:acetate kinase